MSLKNVLKGLLALLVLTFGTMVVTTPALATTNSGSCTTVPSPNSSTLYQMQKYFSVSFSRSGDTGTATIKRLSSKPLCNDQAMVLQSFNMGPNWNGGPDGRDSFVTSLPQTKAYATHFIFGKNETSKTVTVKTPEVCKGTQLDAYVGDQEVAKIVNVHDGENREIGGKIFQPNGKCEVPVKDIKVCDPKTGNIISVPETEKGKYADVNSDKCKVRVCDTSDRTVKLVPKADQNKSGYESENSPKCTEMKVCIKDSGDATLKTITKDKYDSKKHTTNPEECKKPETPKTPETPAPEEPTPPKPEPETPAIIPATGPEIIGGLAGTSALSYGAYTYLASRRAIRNVRK